MKIKSFIFLCILVIYTSIYLMINMGYYEYANYKKKELTEEQIKKFENDVKNGYNIDISSYIENNNDFSRKDKSFLLKTSEFVSNSAKKCVAEMFKMLNNIIEN